MSEQEEPITEESITRPPTISYESVVIVNDQPMQRTIRVGDVTKSRDFSFIHVTMSYNPPLDTIQLTIMQYDSDPLDWSREKDPRKNIVSLNYNLWKIINHEIEIFLIEQRLTNLAEPQRVRDDLPF